MIAKALALAAIVVTLLCGLLLFKSYVDADHTGVALLAPPGIPRVQQTPENWPAAQAERTASKSAYIKVHNVAFDWFSLFPFSQTDGISFILLRLLPLIDPDLWQGSEKFMSEVGLFMDPRSGIDFLPRGIGFSGIFSDATANSADVTSFTCAACHIGRVIGPDGRNIYIDGGVNTEFNINKFYSRLHDTLRRISSGTNRDEQIARLTTVTLDALDRAVAQSPNFFYHNYVYKSKRYDAAYEAAQIALFRRNVDKFVRSFADYTEGFVQAFSYYLDKTYIGFQKEMLSGFPGMADATGVSASHGFQRVSAKIGKRFTSILLPDYPGLTDFMAVWEQQTREAEWDQTKKQLINGGGQYNGNIPIPIFRNIAAETTMGLENPDIRVPAFAVQLLRELPATPYPFAVDSKKAKVGETLFATNCAACHQPNNGFIYDKLGTDSSRSKVINTVLMLAARRGYAEFCPPDLELVMNGETEKPCAEYRGVSLKGFGTAIMRPLDSQAGYNATALRGVWALAPYLHTGSVPTMRHLLMPASRPDRFVKGLIDYDRENMGFAWQGDGSTGGTVFDTTAFYAITKFGHDKDITEGNTTYKLDWSKDPTGAEALIEYLKTL